MPYFVNRRNEQAQKYIIRRSDTQEYKIAITFDAHSESITPSVAYEILDTLRERNIKCTFFLTGAFIEKYPDITKRIANDGHEVASHLYSHTHADELSNRQFKKELLDSAETYYKTTGKKMAPYWRAPGSVKYKTKLALGHKLGYDQIGVSYYPVAEKQVLDMDSFDWVEDKNDPRYLSSQGIKEHVLNPWDKRGGIMLFHLSARDEDPAYVKLPEIFDGLKAQHYQLVSVSELLKDK